MGFEYDLMNHFESSRLTDKTSGYREVSTNIIRDPNHDDIDISKIRKLWCKEAWPRAGYELQITEYRRMRRDFGNCRLVPNNYYVSG